MSRPHIVAHIATLSVLSVYFVLTGCHSSSKTSAPTVAFSKVAPAYQESPYKTDITERDYKTDIIDGRATGARPGQRIVLYAKTDGRWGVCAGNQASRLRISKLTAGGKLQSTWEYNMPLCWLIQPIIRQNKLNLCRSSATAWWRSQLLTGKARRRYSRRPRY
jgi:hypothetical protein